MTNKLTVTIGIPAYNEETNIGYLLEGLLIQENRSYQLEKIIVSSDGSTDKTVSAIREIKSKKIKVIDNKDRQGIARGLNQIISMTRSDILVTLDADIKIIDRDFIEKLISSILKAEADLTSSAISEIRPTHFFDKVLQTGMLLKANLFSSLANKDNIYTCHGLARAYSKRLYRKIHFPISIGNDMYSYLFCQFHNYIYKYTPNALAWYRLPTNYRDHQKQSLRFFKSAREQMLYFGGKLVEKESKISIRAYILGFLKSILIILRRPLHTGCYFFVQLYTKISSKKADINDAWDMSKSTKFII